MSSSCATAIMPFRGVRISWLMLARNMDLASAAVSAATYARHARQSTFTYRPLTQYSHRGTCSLPTCPYHTLHRKDKFAGPVMILQRFLHGTQHEPAMLVAGQSRGKNLLICYFVARARVC